MATTNFLAKYRPLKIGFLVRDGAIEDIVEVAKINTLLWGGIHNPIIPVSSNTGDAEVLIRSLSLDILHPVVQDANTNKVLANFESLKAPHYFTYEMFVKEYHTKKYKVTYLDALNIIDRYYQEHFKGQQKKRKSNCALIRWDADEELKNLFTILFGEYSSKFNLEEDFETAFLKGLHSHEIKIEKNQILNKDIAERVTPITLTSLDLKNYNRDYFNSDGVYLGDPNDFKDLLMFWNLRASGSLIEFLSIPHIERFKDFIYQYINKLINKIKNYPDMHRGTVFYFQSKEKDKVNQIVQQFSGGNTGFPIVDMSKISLYEFLRKLPTDYLSWDFALGNIDQSSQKSVVTLNLPEKKFIADTDRDIGRQALAISIEAMSEFGYGGQTLKPPYIKELNEFYSREITGDPWEIRSEEDSIGIIIDLGDKYKNLYPIPYFILIKRIFELADIKAKISQAGLLAERIIQKLGGSVEDGRVFKIRGVRQLFNTMKSDDSVGRGRATDIIWQNGEFKKHEGLYIETRESKKLTTQDVFDFLLKKDFFKGGLGLICDHCNSSSWLSLRDVGDNWICNYCGYSNKTSLHLRNRGDWKFRRSGLFGKDNSQEGAVPVILTLLVFKRILEPNQFIYSTSVKLEFESKDPEIDFLLLQYEHGDRIQMAFGECKSEGGEIIQEDVDNLKLIRDKIKTLDFDCYLVFAKTADGFTNKELEVFTKLSEENIPIILLTNRELEPYYPYGEASDTEQLPQKYALDLSGMARNSVFRYLEK